MGAAYSIDLRHKLVQACELGAGIAVAFVATIYGAGLVNLLFLPITGRLKARIAREASRREVLTEALAALAAGENPRLIEGRMAAWAA